MTFGEFVLGILKQERVKLARIIPQLHDRYCVASEGFFSHCAQRTWLALSRPRHISARSVGLSHRWVQLSPKGKHWDFFISPEVNCHVCPL